MNSQNLRAKSFTSSGRGRPTKYKERSKLQCNVERADKELLFSYFDEYGMSYCQILSRVISRCADALRQAGYDPNTENDLEAIGEKYLELMDSDFFVFHLCMKGFDNE